MSTELDKARAASADVEHERKARLGPSGVATPGYGLTPKARFVLGAHLKEALAEVDRLAAALAEAEATIANERGEGEPPCEGWEFRDPYPDGLKVADFSVEFRAWCKDTFIVHRSDRRAPPWRTYRLAGGSGGVAFGPCYPTARAAMRAAERMKS